MSIANTLKEQTQGLVQDVARKILGERAVLAFHVEFAPAQVNTGECFMHLLTDKEKDFIRGGLTPRYVLMATAKVRAQAGADHQAIVVTVSFGVVPTYLEFVAPFMVEAKALNGSKLGNGTFTREGENFRLNFTPESESVSA